MTESFRLKQIANCRLGQTSFKEHLQKSYQLQTFKSDVWIYIYIFMFFLFLFYLFSNISVHKNAVIITQFLCESCANDYFHAFFQKR